MFAVIYRWRVKPGMEEQFRDAWHRGTLAIRERFGTGGSRLHRAEDGSWLAYARWPSAEARAAALAQDPDPAVVELRGCVEELVEQIPMTIVDDLLVPDEASD